MAVDGPSAITDLLLTEKEPARRGFLRTLVAAPIAALATHRLILPEQKIITPDDAAERLRTHVQGAEEAMRDLFASDARWPVQVRSWANINDPDDIQRLRARFSRGDAGAVACVGIDAAI